MLKLIAIFLLIILLIYLAKSYIIKFIIYCEKDKPLTCCNAKKLRENIKNIKKEIKNESQSGLYDGICNNSYNNSLNESNHCVNNQNYNYNEYNSNNEIEDETEIPSHIKCFLDDDIENADTQYCNFYKNDIYKNNECEKKECENDKYYDVDLCDYDNIKEKIIMQRSEDQNTCKKSSVKIVADNNSKIQMIIENLNYKDVTKR